MTERTKIFKGFRDTSLSALWQLLLNLLQVALLARWLPPADFAVAAYGAVVVNLCLHLQGAGINAVLVREKHWSPVQLSTFGLLNGLRGLALFAIIVLTAIFSEAPAFAQVLLVHGSALLVYGIGLQYKALLQKALQFKQLALAEGIAAACALVVALLLAIAKVGPLAIAGGYAARYFCETLLLSVLGRKYFLFRWSFSYAAVKPFMAFSFYHLAERIAMFLVAQLDFLLLGWWWGNEVAGVYDALKRVLSRPAGILASIFDRVNFPVWADLHKAPDRLGAAFKATVEQAAFLTQPVYLFACMAAIPVLSVIFGVQWVAHAALFQSLCLVLMWQMLLHPVDTLLLATGHIQWWLGAQLVFAPLLAGFIGLGNTVHGAACGMVGAYAVFALATYAVLGAKYGFAWRLGAAVPLAMSLIVWLVGMEHLARVWPASWYWSVSLAAVAAAACAMGLYLFSPAIRSMTTLGGSAASA